MVDIPTLATRAEGRTFPDNQPIARQTTTRALEVELHTFDIAVGPQRRLALGA